MTVREYHETFEDLINGATYSIGSSSARADVWITSVLDALAAVKNAGKKLFFIGNGASCSMAAHFAVDFTKNAGISSFSSSEGALLTCFSNDFSFETAYREIVRLQMAAGDGLIAISSSGKSKNIINAVQFVKETFSANPIITLSGFAIDNPLFSLGTHNLHINNGEYGFVESAHSYYLHMIIDMFIKKME